MFEDLIKDKEIGIIPPTKDSIIEAMKQNILSKEKIIKDLIDDINIKDIMIQDLKKENDYLKQL